MAHHLAELIDNAENGVIAVERVRARKDATETILKLWEHRTSLPGKAYPLAPYKDLLGVIDRLRPDGNPFKYFGPPAETKRERFAAALFDDFACLIIALLLMKVPPGGKPVAVGTAPVEALSKPEQHVLEALRQWGDLFASPPKRSRRTQKSKSRGGTPTVNLEEAAVSLVDRITATLVELRRELRESGRHPANKGGQKGYRRHS